MNAFGLVYEFFKDCCDAYKLLLKRPGRTGFSIEEFLKLEYIISRSRYLSNNVEEQYKLYENSLVNKEKVDIHITADDTNKMKNSIFDRLARRSSPIELKKDKTQKPVCPSEVDELKHFINSCLHKIYPKKAESSSQNMKIAEGKYII